MTGKAGIAVTLVALTILTSSAVPDKQEKELQVRLNRTECNWRLSQVESALSGYASLTEFITRKSNLAKDYRVHAIAPGNVPEGAAIRIEISGKDLRSCASIGWEDQNIGIPNWIKTVRGYIDYQQYEIMKLNLEILRLKGKPRREIDQLAQKVKQAKRNLEDEYLGEGKWAD